jgi:PEP-CTERM motif
LSKLFFSTRILLTLALAAWPFAASRGAVFTDNTFSDLASYSITMGLVNGGASIAASTCATCGPTSGQALQITSTFPNTPPPPDIYTTVEVLLNPSFVYTPSAEGAITNFTASVDKNLSVNIVLTGAGNTFHPTIEQDGVLYVASIPGPALNNPPGSTGYNNIAADLTAADFLQFDPATDTFGTGTPNFNGDPVELGLTQIFGAGSAEIITADYANMSFAINGGAGTIPEPSTWVMMALGFAGLGFFGYGKTRRANALA